MNIGELVVGYSIEAFWIGVIALGILLLIRALTGKPAFTEKDWLALCGHSRQEVFSRRILLRFAALWLIVVAAGLAIGQWIAPFGLWWLVGALASAAVAVVLVTRWWMTDDR
ncbi:MAG: hypothetical protein WD688_12595 [Candidatus Binatia bacterium]